WIDCTSPMASGKPVKEKNVWRVNGPTDFDNIYQIVNQLDEESKKKYPYFRLAYLTLSSSITQADERDAMNFFQRLVNRLRQTKALSANGHEWAMQNDQTLQATEHVGRYDGQRGWFLPDDFLVHEEHPQDAAKRIAREQTGVELEDARLSHIESFGNGAWHLIFHYRADLPTPTVKPGPNIAATEWFERRKLPTRSEFAHEGWAIDVLKSMEP